MEQQPSVKLSDHVDVEALGGQEEQKQPFASTSTPASPSSSTVPTSCSDGRPPSFYDLRIAVVGNVDSGQSSLTSIHPSIHPSCTSRLVCSLALWLSFEQRG